MTKTQMNNLGQSDTQPQARRKRRVRQGTRAKQRIRVEQEKIFKPILPRSNAKRMMHRILKQLDQDRGCRRTKLARDATTKLWLMMEYYLEDVMQRCQHVMAFTQKKKLTPAHLEFVLQTLAPETFHGIAHPAQGEALKTLAAAQKRKTKPKVE